jgi:hypothetical protein
MRGRRECRASNPLAAPLQTANPAKPVGQVAPDLPHARDACPGRAQSRDADHSVRKAARLESPWTID